MVGVLLSLLGCGDGEAPAVVPLQSDLTGAWTAPMGPPGCLFAVSFTGADGTYAAGISCAAQGSPPNVDRERGAFTLARSGRINFIASEGACAGGRVTVAEYAGTASRPTITLASPEGMVLTRSAAPVFPDDALLGCFDDAWGFALR